MLELRFAVGDREGPLQPGLKSQALRLLESEGAKLDEATILAIRKGCVVGLVCVQLHETCAPAYLGELSAQEAFVSKLIWTAADWGNASLMLKGARSRIQARFGPALQWRFSQKDPRSSMLREAALAAGFKLFQEKRFYCWNERQPAREDSVCLSYRNVNEVGLERYAQLLAASGQGTLDRNDRWYREQAGSDNWGKAFMGYFEAANGKTWLVAFNGSDEPLGLIAVSSLAEPNTATITYVGVLPDRRGAGVIDELLRKGVREARRYGCNAMRSDADVENLPMCAAFERNGHLASCMPRINWHYRA